MTERSRGEGLMEVGRDAVTFTAPGPGSWELDATHRGRRPIAPFTRDVFTRQSEAGSKVLLAKYGLPLERIRAELVEGCLYLRPLGVGEGPVPKKAPPVWIMKVGARIHPELRRRNRTAAKVWRERRWRNEVDQWFGKDRAEVVATNLAFHRVDLSALDDEALVAQVAARLDHFGTQARKTFEAHGADLVPAGDFLAHCRRWGIADADAAALLQGSSPATIETADHLAAVARAISDAAEPPSSVAAVRALGPDAARAVDSWLELHGWRLVTSDDIDKPTLAERPNLQLAALIAAVDEGDRLRASPDPSALRSAVPAEARDQFDELLVEARYGMRQRDDSAGVRWNWSGGLLRRALLEAGQRLVDAGRLDSADQVVELTPDELGPLLLHRTGPSAAEVARRATRRDLVEAAHAPDVLGDPEPPPPIDALPAAMARATAAVMTIMEAEGLAATPTPGQLTGTGIGTDVYRGVARVASKTDDALDRLEPGDVLIAPFTGPSYNSILPILGALVVDAGGPMCHAAIVAREFALPALIGVTGASAQINDGTLVEVDPIAGTLRIID